MQTENILTVVVADDEPELLIRVLSFGPILEVFAPVAFRQLVQDRIRRQLRYAAEPED